jgi:hypothetical protein
MDEDGSTLGPRVEVVATEGAKIWCGAKPGDHFVLRGEKC